MSKRSSINLDDITPQNTPKPYFPRFEDYQEERKQETISNKKATSQKKTDKDVADFKAFYAMDEKQTKLLLYDHNKITNDLLPVFDFAKAGQSEKTRPKKMSFEDVISEVFSDKILDALIEMNIEKTPNKGKNTQKLPSLFYHINQGM